ncbi:MAG: hypothetical protein OCD76_16945 [Reichenbachiella sp.]
MKLLIFTVLLLVSEFVYSQNSSPSNEDLQVLQEEFYDYSKPALKNFDTEKYHLLYEYLLYNYYSWRNVSHYGIIESKEINSLFDFNFEDTITLNKDLNVFILPSDTTSYIVLDKSCCQVLKSGTKLNLKNISSYNKFNPSFDLITINLDSNILASTTYDDLIIDQKGYKRLISIKNENLQKLNKTQRMFDNNIQVLANKEGISIDSLYKALARQYFEVTGNPIFTH